MKSKLSITTADLPACTAGRPYSAQIQAQGGALPYHWQCSCPGDLHLDSETGELTGVINSPGTIPLYIVVYDSNNANASASLLLNVMVAELVFTPPVLPEVIVDTSYFTNLKAKGGQRPYNFSIDSGGLPHGFTLSEGGFLSGLSSNAGCYDVVVAVKDSKNRKVTGILQLNIVENLGLLNATKDVVCGKLNSWVVVATGGVSPYQYNYIGAPDGLKAYPNGHMDWNPTVAMSASMTVVVTDSMGVSKNLNYNINSEVRGWGAVISLTTDRGNYYYIPLQLCGLSSGLSVIYSSNGNSGSPIIYADIYDETYKLKRSVKFLSQAESWFIADFIAGASDRLIFIAGWVGDWDLVVSVYDYESNKFLLNCHRIQISMPSCLVWFNGRMWGIGSEIAYSSASNAVISSVDGYEWTSHQPPPWTPRNGIGAAVYMNRLWVGGGYISGQGSNYIYCSDYWSTHDGVVWRQEASAPWGDGKSFMGQQLTAIGDTLYAQVTQGSMSAGYNVTVWSLTGGIWSKIHYPIASYSFNGFNVGISSNRGNLLLGRPDIGAVYELRE